MAGKGFSLEKVNSEMLEGCSGTECMNGHIFGRNLSDIRGGKCPNGTRWAFVGGAGGGGSVSLWDMLIK